MARFGPFRWVAGLLLNHWGTKTTAIVLASVFFILTRDDVSREFTVPLHVIKDKQRKLRTPLPKTVTAEVHGPWTRINRLSASDLGRIELDVSTLQRGPFELDESLLVMPPGVLLRGMVYEKVDVRFDEIIKREFMVVQQVVVEPDPDFDVVSVVVNPNKIWVEGPKSVLQEISNLETENLSVSGVSENQQKTVSVLRPHEEVKFADMGGERPNVTVDITVRAKSGERKLDVDLVRVPEIPGTARIPTTFPVSVRGPLPALRRLDGVKAPVTTQMEVVPPTAPDGVSSLAVKFVVTDKIPEEVRASLVLDPPSKRFDLIPTPQLIPQ
ncbi:MAG: CdaR family protein [Nannocystaceae bacterium]